jgi:serine/threonine protein kinase
MNPERWRRIESLFNEAVAIAPPERERWLEEACAGDASLRSEVLSLLANDRDPDATLDHREAGASAGSGAAKTAAAPRRVGPYELLEAIGRGGMGTVYKARRADDEYHSTVAVKLVRPGMDTEFILSRFRRERQTLARLSHPNIARLLDGGTTEEGVPYIVMEYIDGVWITDYCQEKRLKLRERLRLFLPVCRAVDYAHRSFVVHRDI